MAIEKPKDNGNAPGETRSPLRFLLVDDHSVVRSGLRQMLSERFPDAEFAEAGSEPEALARLNTSPWDVMFLDMNLPGRGGLDVLNHVRISGLAVRVLVLTTHPEDQYAVRVLKAGAAGYLTKASAPELLLAAVDRILAGGKYISPTLAESLAGTIATPTDQPAHELLSDREYQILRMMAAGKVAKEISAELSLSVKTISTYRARLLKKMNLKSTAEVIRYAVQAQLVD